MQEADFAESPHMSNGNSNMPASQTDDENRVDWM